MNKKTLEKISNGKYFVEQRSTHKKRVGEICNFYIDNITIYQRGGKDYSFEITLKNENKKKDTRHFPISYLYEPMCWFYFGFDIKVFCINTTKKVFEESMVEIVNIIFKNDEYTVMNDYVGWHLKASGKNPFKTNTKYYLFGKFEEPGVPIKIEEYDDVANILFEYIKLTDISISAPLLSYMLLSVLTGLGFLGTNVRADFNIALTGGTKELRRRFALFFANLYKRDPSFLKDEYELFHINKNDTVTDIRLKTAYAKDCVLIAFEPDTRHLNFLLDEIYKTNVINAKCPIENLLLFTGEHFEKRKSGKVLVVQLDNDHNTKAIENHFEINYIEPLDDLDSPVIINSLKDDLTDNIYRYITILTRKLIDDRSYVQNEFENHKKAFYEKYSSTDASDNAKSVAQLLFFGFYMYTKCLNVENDTICNDVYRAIFESAMKSFPTDENFENAKITCIQIDSYFNSEKTQSFIGKIGCEEIPSEKSVWYDDSYIYIKHIRISEFLKLTDSKLKYNINVKKSLADKEIVKTYVKKDGKLEYSVHLQKILAIENNADDTTNSKTSKSKQQTYDRYVAFNRENCRHYNLFPNIEKTIANRCQIDVKQEKK